MKNLIKKIIKEELQRLNEDKVTPTFVKDFLSDFGILISLNFSQITKMGKDSNSTKELEEMMKVIRKPIINGQNYFDFVNNNNNIINNPKLLSALLNQVRELLIYIEPRIIKFVKDEPSILPDGNKINYKQKWLDRINKIKENYKKIISPNIINEKVTKTKVICDNCGWSWNIKDGGKDPYVCHKCGHDNTPKKKLKEEQKNILNEKCWKGYTQKGMKTMFGKRYPNCVKKLKEQETKSEDYSKWKRKNVTLRGIKELGKPNEVYGSFGKGLYTVPLSNKSMARQYGDVYFVVNAIPKNPKVVQNLNDAEILRYKLVDNYCKENNVNYSLSFFENNTSMDIEMIKLGYDGLIIKGREMVNYTPNNIKYFRTENELERYHERL